MLEDHPTLDLITRARGGEESAYDELFARSAERLRLFLRVRLGPELKAHEQSDDLLQETWLQAHRSFGSFEMRGEGAFVRWLCQIAENRIRARLEHHRADKRRAPAGSQRLSCVMERVAAYSKGPLSQAAGSERHERMASALEQLPQDERAAVLMRHFEGVTLDAIADRLGLPATSARRLLGRATVHLGQLLKGEFSKDELSKDEEQQP